MSDSERDDKMVLTGYVINSNKGVFLVQVNENHIVNCKLSGKMKLHEIRVIQNDTVIIEVSPYCLDVGRIIKRLKANEPSAEH